MHVVERKPVTTKKIVEEVVVMAGNGNVNEIQRENYARPVQESIIQSNFNSYSVAEVRSDQNSATEKQMSFYERLKAKKSEQERGNNSNYSNYDSFGAGGKGYGSNVPVQPGMEF